MVTRKRLSEAQIESYQRNGYLTELSPIFDELGREHLNKGYEKLVSLLQEDENPSDIMRWHRTSRWLYDICTQPQILDYVEDLLGPDFFLWGSEFITKAPYTEKTVPWHQDSYYWPLSPHHTVTVWLAFTDVDEHNGAMQVVPGSHKGGVINHCVADEKSILSFELEQGSFRTSDAISLRIPAGGISLHDDAIVHGSPPNDSDRWRIGYVIRYSGTDVKCDVGKNPNFLSYMVRGVDRYKHNPQGDIPQDAFGRPPYNKRIRQV